jgi:hypothetical protein
MQLVLYVHAARERESTPCNINEADQNSEASTLGKQLAPSGPDSDQRGIYWAGVHAAGFICACSEREGERESMPCNINEADQNSEASTLGKQLAPSDPDSDQLEIYWALPRKQTREEGP